MSKIVQLSSFRKKKEKESFLVRGRSPLYMTHRASQEDLGTRLAQLDEQIAQLLRGQAILQHTEAPDSVGYSPAHNPQ